MGQELTIKNVNKSFEVNGEKINVLNDINLDIKEGEFVVLVGHSGCGKSTLLKIIAGLEKNDTGLVAAGGQEITGACCRSWNDFSGTPAVSMDEY